MVRIKKKLVTWKSRRTLELGLGYEGGEMKKRAGNELFSKVGKRLPEVVARVKGKTKARHGKQGRWSGGVSGLTGKGPKSSGKGRSAKSIDVRDWNWSTESAGENPGKFISLVKKQLAPDPRNKGSLLEPTDDLYRDTGACSSIGPRRLFVEKKLESVNPEGRAGSPARNRGAFAAERGMTRLSENGLHDSKKSPETQFKDESCNAAVGGASFGRGGVLEATNLVQVGRRARKQTIRNTRTYCRRKK